MISFLREVFGSKTGSRSSVPGGEAVRGGRGRRKPRHAAGAAVEPLEARLAMAVSVLPVGPAGASPGFVTVVADDGSDIYFHMPSTKTNDLFIGDNASFLNRNAILGPNASATLSGGQSLELRNVDTLYDQILVANGGFVSYANLRPTGHPYMQGAAANTLEFALPTQDVFATEALRGSVTVSNATGATVQYAFSNRIGDDPAPFYFTSPNGAGRDLSVTFGRTGGVVCIRLESSLFAGAVSAQLGDITFVYERVRVGDSFISLIATRSFIEATTVNDRGVHRLNPFAANLVGGRRAVGGTLSGEVTVTLPDGRPATLPFTNDSLLRLGGGTSVPLRFDGTTIRGSLGTTPVLNAVGGGREFFLTGDFDFDTGELSFTTPFPIQVDRVSVAISDPEAEANLFTLMPGRNFSRSLSVELAASGSAARILSPIIDAEFVEFGASTVAIDAPVSVTGQFRGLNASSSILNAVTEVMSVNATVSSPVYDIRLSDDPRTTSIERARLVVSQTGSLSQVGDVLQAVSRDDELDPAALVFVEVIEGDVFIEGRVVGANQTFMLVSDREVQSDDPSTPVNEAEFADENLLRSPYRLTTRSSVTGADIGVIEGGTLSVILANDMPTWFDDSSAFSELSITTAVDRIRVRATDRRGDPLEYSFPYVLKVSERDEIFVDAVASSSFPISLEAAGRIDMLSSLTSADDVTIRSQEAFVVSAPLATSFGKITLSAPELDVRNSVRVLDTFADERTVDILLEATDGPLVIRDAVYGLNVVRLEQKAQAGSASAQNGITGQARVAGDLVLIRSSGNVDLLTDANLISVTADGDVAIDELTDVVVDVTSKGAVSLVTNGFDLVGDFGAGSPQFSPSLFATIYEASKLSVSAPNGSVDVEVNTSVDLMVGNLEKIIDGTARNMVAAGSVIIRSSLAGLTVHDAPLPLGSATAVDYATVDGADGIFGAAGGEIARYDNRLPGLYPSRITVTGLTDGRNPLGLAKVNSLRDGDRILVTGGVSGAGLAANGVYVVSRLSFPSATTASFTLTRVFEADTTAELADMRYYYVRKGPSANRHYVSRGFQNVAFEDSTPLAPATPLSAGEVRSQAGYVVARATTTAPITTARFDRSTGAITSSVNQFLPPGLFDGVELALDDIVLVRNPVRTSLDGEPLVTSELAIGLYRVTSVGRPVATDGGGGTPWVLERYSGRDEDGDGTIDPIAEAVVHVDEGSLRTRRTGNAFRLAFASLGNAPLPIERIGFYQLDAADPAATPPFDPTREARLDIGSDNPLSTVSFVVSSENGITNSVGSLGKMIRLRLQNSGFVPRAAAEQAQSVVFDASVEDILLEQELPTITKGVSIAAARSVLVDGSRITLDEFGGPVRAGSRLAGIGPLRQSRAIAPARRLVRDAGSLSAETINGFTFDVAADGSVLRNLRLGGFSSGSAVHVVGAENVLLEDLVLGLDSREGRLPNRVGLLVESGMGATANHTTLLDGRVFNSLLAGIQVAGSATDVKIVQTTVGRDGGSNGIGVLAEATAGQVHVGLAPITPLSALQGISFTTVSGTSSGGRLSTTVSSKSGQLLPGMEIYQAVRDRRWTITGISGDPADSRRLLVDVTGPALGAGETIVAEAGNFVVLERGQLTFTAPRLVSADSLFVGQRVSGTIAGIIPTAARIASIQEAAGNVVITLTAGVLKTGTTGLLFEAPGRNTVARNGDGIVLRDGSVSILGTDVQQNVFDGIRIEGVAASGSHRIGGIEGAKLSTFNNTIHSNGVAGIRFSGPETGGRTAGTRLFFGSGYEPAEPGFTNPPGEPPLTDAQKQAKARQIVIQGNYIGTNTRREENLGNGVSVAVDDVRMRPPLTGSTARRPADEVFDPAQRDRWLATWTAAVPALAKTAADYVPGSTFGRLDQLVFGGGDGYSVEAYAALYRPENLGNRSLTWTQLVDRFLVERIDTLPLGTTPAATRATQRAQLRAALLPQTGFELLASRLGFDSQDNVHGNLDPLPISDEPDRIVPPPRRPVVRR